MTTEISKEVSASSGIIYGRTTVGLSAVQIAPKQSGDRTGKLEKGFLIRNMSTNSAILFCGGSTVTAATGFPIGIGEWIHVPCDDISQVYLISTDTDQVAAWIGV